MAGILPRSLLALTLFSLLLSSITFILSLFTFGIASLWLNVIAVVLTVFYHGATFVVSWRRILRVIGPAPASESHTWKSLMCAAFILGTWILALAVTLETTIIGGQGLAISEQNGPWNDAVQVGHSVTLAVQVLTFSGVLIYCIHSRRISGSSALQFYDEEHAPSVSLRNECSEALN